MTMGFSQQLRDICARSWDLEKRHPFVVGIGDGSLPLESFRYYMRQDYIFLIDFCRVIAMAAAKAQSIDDMSWFARLLHETLDTEMSLHVGFCEDFGITVDDLEATRPSPATMAYTRHLIESAFSGGAAEIAAAILPCSWGYAEIGQHLAERGAQDNQPLYGRWIQMYASPEFAALAEWLRAFVDRESEASSPQTRQRMKDLFVTSSRYEYMFWDAAYRQEQWPV